VRLLWAIVLALTPVVAWAGSGSGSMSVNIQPIPSAPSEAVAAGFTHLAQSWDFSQSLYAVLSN
jgi:hypothetical protein